MYFNGQFNCKVKIFFVLLISSLSLVISEIIKY